MHGLSLLPGGNARTGIDTRADRDIILWYPTGKHALPQLKHDHCEQQVSMMDKQGAMQDLQMAQGELGQLEAADQQAQSQQFDLAKQEMLARSKTQQKEG